MAAIEVVYLVILEDRHTNLQIDVFATEADARAEFQAVVDDYADCADQVDPDDQAQGQALVDDDTLAHHYLTGESDRVWIAKKTVTHGEGDGG